MKNLVDAFKIRTMEGAEELSQPMAELILSEAEKHFGSRIEAFKMTQYEFLSLLELFLAQKWRSRETSDLFTKGFTQAPDCLDEAGKQKFKHLISQLDTV